MIRVYPVSRAEQGEYLDNFPVNRELANLVGRHNNLDRWALDGRLARTKFASGTWAKVHRRDEGTAQSVGPYSYSVTQPSITVMGGIPDNSGAPWLFTEDTGDGLLRVDLTAYVLRTGGLAFYRVGVLVDSIVACVSPTYDQHENDCAESILASGVVPVGGGEHVIEPFFQLWAENSTSIELEFRDRAVTLWEALR